MSGLKDMLMDSTAEAFGITARQSDFKSALAVEKLKSDKLKLENEQLKTIIRRTTWELNKVADILGNKGE